jgi:hypothetical protein
VFDIGGVEWLKSRRMWNVGLPARNGGGAATVWHYLQFIQTNIQKVKKNKNKIKIKIKEIKVK